MAGTYSQFTRSYNAFSGVDILVTFAGVHVGEVQGISFTVTREKAPNYTMGSADPRSFSRGKRGIAGSLIFLTFDREALIDSVRHLPEMRYLAKADDLRYHQQTNAVPPVKGPTPVKKFSVVGGVDTAPGTDTLNFPQIDYVLAEPMYLDQLPPFNIVLSAFNEYGHTMRMMIHGVEILNSGSGTSVDDITIDTTATFVATSITRWHNQGFVDANGVWHDAHDRTRPPVGAGSQA